MQTDGKGDRATARVAMALASVYAPYSWLLLMGGGWDSYRWSWFRMWPILPGLLVHAIPGVHQGPDWQGWILMGAATMMIVVPVVLLARGSRQAAVMAALVVGVLSGMNSWLAYQLYWA